MQLDQTRIALRPRRHWQAIDVGFSMTRQWLVPLYTAWLCVLVPLAVVLHLACWQVLWLAPLLLWWLKPLLDRVPLYFLSRAVFGAAPSLGQTLRALPGLLWPQAFAVLTWRRLDPARSFHLPVLQLEGLNKKPRRERQKILDRTNHNAGGWLTFVCINIEIALEFALFGLIWMMFPEFLSSVDWLYWLESPSTLDQILFNLAWVCAMLVMEPLYVAGGFALYLNRRTVLEAWDLEIGFRKLAARLEQVGAKAALLAGIVLLSVMILPQEVMAESDPKRSRDCKRLFEQQEHLQNADSKIKQALADVLADPAFPRCELKTHWRLIEKEPEETVKETDWSDFGKLLASILRIALWVGLASVVIALIWWLRKRGVELPTLARTAEPPPLVIHGETVTAESFDPTAADQAWQLWRDGEQRQALGLLYRASLAGMMRLHQINFGRSATEGECLDLAKAQLSDTTLQDFFQHLTLTWQTLAYAHRPPTTAAIEQLCQQWPGHFSNPVQTP